MGDFKISPDTLKHIETLYNSAYIENNPQSLQELTMITDDPNNFDSFLALSMHPDAPFDLRSFSANTTTSYATTYSYIWSIEKVEKVCRTIFKFLQENCTTTDFVISELAHTLGITIFINYQRSETMHSIFAEIKDLHHHGNQQLWNIELLIETGIFQLFPKFSIEAGLFFVSQFLDQIYESSYIILRQIGQSSNPYHLPIISSAIHLSSLCLSFSLEDELPSSHTFPSRGIQTKVCDPITIEFYFQLFSNIMQLFNSSMQTQSIQNDLQELLKCIISFASASQSTFGPHIFGTTSPIPMHINNIVNGSIGILNQPFPISLRPHFCLLIEVLGKKFSLSVIREVTQIRQFITLVGNLTHQLVDEEDKFRENQLSISSLFSFWTYLFSIFQNTGNTEIKVLVSSIENSLCLKYFDMLMLQVSGNDPEYIWFILQDGQQISSFIKPIQTLFLSNPCEIGSELLARCDSEMTPPQRAMMIQTLTAILLSKPSKRDTKAISHHPTIFTRLINMAQMENNNELIEASILEFLSQFKNTYFGSPNSELYKSITIMPSYTDVLAFILKRTRDSLNNFSHDDTVMKKASNVFVIALDLASKIDKLHPMLTDLVEHHGVDMFPFIQSPNYRKYWKQIIFNLAQMVVKSKSRVLLKKFLMAYENVDTFWSYAIDFEGIFNSLQTVDDFNVVFDYFFPQKADLLVKAMNEEVREMSDAVSILRCWERMVNPINRRISFSNVSPNGVILFKASSSLVLPLFKPDFSMKQIKYVFRILEHLFAGDYVLFEAFEIYQDSSLNDVLSAVISFIRNVNLDELFSHPPVALDLVKMLVAICTRAFGSLLKTDPAIVPLLIMILSKGMESTDFELICISADLDALVEQSNQLDQNSIPLLRQANIRLLQKVLLQDNVSPQHVAPALMLALIGDRSILDAFSSVAQVTNGAFETFINGLDDVLKDDNKSAFMKKLADLQHDVQSYPVSYVIARI